MEAAHADLEEIGLVRREYAALQERSGSLEGEERAVDLSYLLSLDVERAERLFEVAAREHPAVLDDPAPAIKIHELTDSGVEFLVRPWVKTNDYWPTRWDLNREIKLRLDREGLEMGALRRDVRMRGETS